MQGSPFCEHCDDADEPIFSCPSCAGVMAFGENSCPRCGTIYNDDFWDKILDDWDVARPNSGYNEAEDRTLCCNKFVEDCRCVHTVFGDEVYEAADDAYDRRSETCEHCAHYKQPSCPPLRQYTLILRTEGFQSIRLHKIEPCDNFELWNPASDTDSDISEPTHH